MKRKGLFLVALLLMVAGTMSTLAQTRVSGVVTDATACTDQS